MLLRMLETFVGDTTGLVLMPPRVSYQVSFLVLSIFEAQGMPKMDTANLGHRLRSGIDAFVEVKVRYVGYGRSMWMLLNRSRGSLPANSESE